METVCKMCQNKFSTHEKHCPKCATINLMYVPEKSLFQAMQEGDTESVNKIRDNMKSGVPVRIF